MPPLSRSPADIGTLRCRATLVDIDADSSLADKFGECVPVLTVDGKLRFRGKINEILLQRLLAQVEVPDRGSV